MPHIEHPPGRCWRRGPVPVADGLPSSGELPTWTNRERRGPGRRLRTSDIARYPGVDRCHDSVRLAMPSPVARAVALYVDGCDGPGAWCAGTASWLRRWLLARNAHGRSGAGQWRLGFGVRRRVGLAAQPQRGRGGLPQVPGSDGAAEVHAPANAGCRLGGQAPGRRSAPCPAKQARDLEPPMHTDAHRWDGRSPACPFTANAAHSGLMSRTAANARNPSACIGGARFFACFGARCTSPHGHAVAAGQARCLTGHLRCAGGEQYQ